MNKFTPVALRFVVLLLVLAGPEAFSRLHAGEDAKPDPLRALMVRLAALKDDEVDAAEINPLSAEERMALGGLVLDPDRAVSRGAKRALSALATTFGPELGGLRLAAVQTGPVSSRNQCTTLWIVIKNVSKNGLYLRQVNWQPQFVLGDNVPESSLDEDSASSRELFRTLSPGESVGMLIDVDTSPDLWDHKDVRLALELRPPTPLWHPDICVETAQNMLLVSAPISLAANAEPVNEEFDKLLARAVNDEDEAIEALSNHPRQREILRYALRAPTTEMRIWALSWIGVEADSALLDPVFDAVIRHGPRADESGESSMVLQELYQTSPGIAWYSAMRRTIREMPYFISILYNLAGLTNWPTSFVTNEQELALDVLLTADKRNALHVFSGDGAFSDNAQERLAWLLHTTADEQLRDSKRAAELMAHVRAQEDTPIRSFMAASMTGDEETLQSFAKNAPVELANNIAWHVAIAPHQSPRDGMLAFRLAKRAAEESANEDGGLYAARLDTLAAVYATCVGDFGNAVATQRKANQLVAIANEIEFNFAWRLVRYIAHANEDRAHRPKSVFSYHRFRSDAVREAMLKLVKNENETVQVRHAARLVLNGSFPNHPDVVALPQEENTPEEEEPAVEIIEEVVPADAIW